MCYLKDERLFFPATKRNTIPIINVFKDWLPSKGIVLEIGSGSGEHAVAFQKEFPKVRWQTSDPDSSCRKSIRSWIKHEKLEHKMQLPLNLEIKLENCILPSKIYKDLTSIVSINVLHVSSWEFTQSLFKISDLYLKEASPLIIYGPFKKNGIHTSISNELFDHSLRSKNKSWGIRDLDKIVKVSSENNFKSPIIIKMPANNISLIFHKREKIY